MDRRDVLAVASLTLSMIALFVAVSGVAGAGKKAPKIPANSIGSKQLKPGAVRAADIAPGAVTAKAIAAAAVTSSAIAPDAVTSPAIADHAVRTSDYGLYSIPSQAYKPGSVGEEVIEDDSIGEDKIEDEAISEDKIETGAVGDRQMAPLRTVGVDIDQVTMNLTSPGCSMRVPIDLSGSISFDEGGFFDAANPGRLTAPVDGRYSVYISGEWPEVDDAVNRGLWARKFFGSGPQVGQVDVDNIKIVQGPPSLEGTTSQGLHMPVTLKAGDYIDFAAVQCGVGSGGPINNVSISMHWVGKVF